jgi:hypothetical protein
LRVVAVLAAQTSFPVVAALAGSARGATEVATQKVDTARTPAEKSAVVRRVWGVYIGFRSLVGDSDLLIGRLVPSLK